ncbi:MAG TPA: N-acetylmuramoyl-L-alanine amidase [Candidatus Binatia bacterium]|nr:N-acetylmuramoyl-L-alanine amidase [Candidatus Binatia bacterium]
MRRRFLSSLPAFASGSFLSILLSFGSSDAAVVRSISASSSPGLTRIIVACDGAASYRSGPGEGSYVVEIAGAQLGRDAPRLLPVADALVHGVAVVASPESDGVRLHVHLADASRSHVDVDEGSGELTIRVARSGSPSAEAQPPSPAHRSSSTADTEHASAARDPSAARTRIAARPLIVIDPGHGGKDPGAKVWAGEFEKDIVLAIATAVADRLRRRLDVDVVMTRTSDVFVSLQDRRAMVRQWNADLFVSIHANASGNQGASGVETYYAREASIGGSHRLSRARNGAGAFGRKTASLERNGASPRLAKSIQRELVRHLGMRYKAVRDLGVKEGRFFVLKDNEVPSVLVEAAFLTHREEGLRIRSESYRDMAAEGIVGGIAEYLSASAASPL